MNNFNKGKHKRPNGQAASNSFRDLIHQAFADSPDAPKAYDQLRTTYLKEVKLKNRPRKQYWNIFPKGMLRVDEKSRVHPEERERLHSFWFSINTEAVCFIRNLWFAHQFFSKPSEVEQFLTATNVKDRRSRFERRFEELKTLASTYAGWLKAADNISKKLGNFRSTKTDLLTALKDMADSSVSAPPLPKKSGSAAVADMIREVEQRASYQAGNPDDACEKALYFLALGRPDIGEIIAREVPAENPDHAGALYANAVLLLNASERHREQAFVHDVMHPHDLAPMEAEEFYHADQCAQESLQAMEKESQVFLLMLKVRQNWPKELSIKCYDLSPSMWQHKVEEWILWQAAARLAENGRDLSLSRRTDVEAALEALRWIVADIWKKQSRSLYSPFFTEFLHRFIIVAAFVNTEIARECLRKLESSLEHSKLQKTESLWRSVDMLLPVSQEPTLAEAMLPAVANSRFCAALFATTSTAEAAAFLRRIAHAGLGAERDRKAVLRSLALRSVVRNIVRGGELAHATELCRETAEHYDWPASETGNKLQACWRYGVVLLLFESSRISFEKNDLKQAADHAELALELSTDWLESIAGEKALVKHSDWDADTEVLGDFYTRQSNIVTDTRSSEFFSPISSWKHANPLHPAHKACWNDFVKWAEKECPRNSPLLLAYGNWLARHHGQASLLSRCDAFSLKLASLNSK